MGLLQAEIMSCRFDPTGQNVAACSADRSVCKCVQSSSPSTFTYFVAWLALWRTYAPNTNYGLLSTLHKAPILDFQWSIFSSLIYTASADQTLSVTDLTTGQRARKLRAHRGIVNSLDRTLSGAAGMELIASGSDDGTVRVWEGGDDGGKQPVAVFEIGCPVTAVCWSADGSNIYAAALDNEIHVRAFFICLSMCSLFTFCLAQVLDLRKNEQVFTLLGHNDTPISLSLSPNGSFLLAPDLESHTIIHDVRPFSPTPSRVHRTLMGAPAGFEKTLLRGAWSKDEGGRRGARGGADRTVCIWDVDSGNVLYKVSLWLSHCFRLF